MNTKLLNMNEQITLQEGLALFQQKNQQYFSDKPSSLQAKEFLKNHDIAHVVFGCDTSIYGEGLVKIWSTFGTSISFRKLTKGYRSAQAFELSREYSFGHVLKNIFRLLGIIPKAIIRARRMSKPWPLTDYAQYMDRSLEEIRSEFNIHIL